MGPGPPPMGPWGASRGVPGRRSRPKLLGPEVAEPSWIWYRFFYLDFDIDFRSSWSRFGLRLGGHFRSFWRLGRPKLVPKPSSNRLNIEKVNFHETSAGVVPERF